MAVVGNPTQPLPKAGDTLAPYQIEAGDRIAVTLKSGTRIAGKANGRMRSGRGISWTLPITGNDKKSRRLEGADIDTILYLG